MPQKMNKRNAVYLDPSLHKALKAKSEVSGISISELVNKAVCEELVEDYKDLENARIEGLLKISRK